MKRAYEKALYLAWAPFNRRAESFSSHFRAELCYVHYLKYRSVHWAPLKYPLMAVKTLILLKKKQPRLVFTMSPPLFAALFVWIYCAVHRCPMILDAHTGSLISFPWTVFRFLHKFLCRRSLFTIVTNDFLVELVRSWGGRPIIVNPPITYPDVPVKQLEGKFNVLVVNTFAMDEPLDEILDAASETPEAHFYVTGRLRPGVMHKVRKQPSNIHFTDFVAYEEYVSYLKSVDAVIAMTTRDHTLQSGGREAVFMGRALITTAFPYLMEHFNRGTCYATPESASIRKAVKDTIRLKTRMEKEMVILQKEKQAEWFEQVERIKHQIDLLERNKD